jgi:hypothetical protein
MRRVQVLILLAAAWAVVSAQQTREVRGVVNDQNGRPVAGAVVQMTNLHSGQVWTCSTQSGGRYRFQAVHFGESYRLEAKFRDHAGSVRHLSEYDWRPEAVINLRVDVDRWKNPCRVGSK